ncbi:MAG: hypothetical protein ACRDRU_23820 [Pseudonocardiaceae bacterium]
MAITETKDADRRPVTMTDAIKDHCLHLSITTTVVAYGTVAGDYREIVAS